MKYLSVLFSLVTTLVLTVPAAVAETRTDNLYWAPPNVTVGGKDIDMLLNFIFWLTLAVFIGTQGVYIYYLIRYRRRPGVKAHYSHGNNYLEVIWTSIPTAIFIILAIVGNRIWFNLHRTPPEDALRIDVVSYQFGWDFRYAGKDGQLGDASSSLFTIDNKFGVKAEDKAGADDFTSTELVIPVGKAVNILLRSRDVIHSFYVPEFRLYQDAVPGRTISWVWFEVIRPGNFELACSQLCGTGHYNMKAKIRVLPQEEFDAWYAEKMEKAATARKMETSPSIAKN